MLDYYLQNRILKGNVNEEIKTLTALMNQASIELNFEKAIEKKLKLIYNYKWFKKQRYIKGEET